MLILGRKLGEKILIGDNICITVVDTERGKVRLGIECPRDMPIYRQELSHLMTKPVRPASYGGEPNPYRDQAPTS